jgi:hypothetical protein
VIEFAGFDKMVRSAWVELQLLSEQYGKPLEILHYSASPGDVKIFDAELAGKKSSGLMPGHEA